MDAFEIDELVAEHEERGGPPYLEFLRSPSLTAGLYRLPAGGVDPQRPHAEDEVYYVVSGAARVRVGEEDRQVRAGSVVFVAAGVDHRFHDISEDALLLVFFAPAETLPAGLRAPLAGHYRG